MRHISYFAERAIVELVDRWDPTFVSTTTAPEPVVLRPMTSIYGPGKPPGGLIHVIGGFSHRAVRSVSAFTFLSLKGTDSRRQALIITPADKNLIVERLLSAICGMGFSDIEIASATPDELKRAMNTLTWLGKQSIYLADPLNTSHEEFINLLRTDLAQSSLVWIEGLNEFHWIRLVHTDHYADGAFYRELHGTTRTRQLSTLISVGGRTTEFDGQDALPRLDQLPGDGTLEEIAHIVEWVQLHEPDDFGIATEEYIDLVAAKSKVGPTWSTSRFGWNEALSHAEFGSRRVE